MAHSKKSKKYSPQNTEEDTIGAVAAGAAAGTAVGMAIGGSIGSLPGIAIGAILGATAGAVAAETAFEKLAEHELPHVPEKKKSRSRKTHIPEQAIACPERVYAAPEEVAADRCLKKEDKLRILDSWMLDEGAMIRAEGENMTSKSSPDTDPDELLQRISTAKSNLEGM